MSIKAMEDVMTEEIVNVRQAAQILAEKHGRTIEEMQEYIRQLRRQGRLQATNEDEEGTRAYLFRRGDVEQIVVHRRGEKRGPRTQGKTADV
jgi:hypothetical protein